jgi:multidrug efflux pump
MVQVNLTASTSLHARRIQEPGVKQVERRIVRLKDVATVTLGADSYDRSVGFDGKTGVLSASRSRRAPICSTSSPACAPIFPGHPGAAAAGAEGEIVYDSTDFVNSSIHEVESR